MMELEEQIQLQVKDAVLDLQTAEENIPITKKAVAQGEENLRVSRERYKAQAAPGHGDLLRAMTLDLQFPQLVLYSRASFFSAVRTADLDVF
jgi:Outer membrane efflux protein